MTTNQQYDRKKLIILRAVLIVIGGGVGGTALWQYFVYFPDVVSREFQIVIATVSAAVLAAILGLSAKPFYRLGKSIAEAATGLVNKLGGRGIAAIVLGLIAAVGFVIVFDVIIRSVQGIWAVRLLTDILVYIVFAALCCYGFTVWFSSVDKDEEKSAADVGYLISVECFSDERVVTAVNTLINVKVCDGAYKALCLSGSDGESARRLDESVRSGKLTPVKCAKNFADMSEYLQVESKLAAVKRLRLVTPNGENGLSLSVFAPPTEKSSTTDDERGQG